jgi:CheY-like chemotaxis protein
MSVINDILDISKVEAGTMEINNVPYSLSSLLGNVITMIQVRVAEKPIIFLTDIDASLPNVINGDEARIRQILINLLSNAVKYTDEGFIRLSVCGKNDPAEKERINISFEVADSGIGINEEDIPNLFRSFARLNIKKNKNVEGTGLGLAITRSICRMMNGDVNVTSSYGKGSVFSTVIPHGIIDKEPHAIVENPGDKTVLCYEKQTIYAESIARTLKSLGVPAVFKTNSEEFLIELSTGNYPFAFVNMELIRKAGELIKEKSPDTTLVLLANAGETKPKRNLPVLSAPAYTIPVANILNRHPETEVNKWQGENFIAPDAQILVVDDITANLVVTSGLLAEYQSQVDTCTNGPLAISMVQRKHYDLVFMDYMMPEMDGIEVIRTIRAMEGDYYRKLPIVALTANAIIGMKEKFLSHGFNDYLSKPIEISKLDEIMLAWLPKEKQQINTEQHEAQNEEKENEAFFPEGFMIDGIDIETGIAQYKESVYLNVLRSYHIQTPGLLQKLCSLKSNVFSERTLNEYAITVHGLKGSNYGICAYAAAKQAEKLEQAAKSGDIQFIKANNDSFVENIEGIIIKIKELLASLLQQKGEKPLCRKPDPALLKKLADACKHYKTSEMEEIIGKLEAYKYESGDELVAWLREQADNLEYEAISEKIEKL